MSASNRLAVVICTYKRSGSLIGALASLYARCSTGDECVDIGLVTNNCSDDTLAHLADFRTSRPRDNRRLSSIEELKVSKPGALYFLRNDLNGEAHGTHQHVLPANSA